MERMRNAVIWAIRDSRHFNAVEKAFLAIAVESRGPEAWGTAQRIADDIGCSLPTMYRARKRLTEMGVLIAESRPGTTTKYRVNAGWFSDNASNQNERGSLSGEEEPLGKMTDPSRQNEKDVYSNREGGLVKMKLEEEPKGDSVRGLLSRTEDRTKGLIRASDILVLSSEWGDLLNEPDEVTETEWHTMHAPPFD